MIRKIKLYIVLVAVLLSASSCLDKYPQDAIPQEEAIKTVSDVRQALVGIYAQFKNASLYSGYLTLLPDIQTDLVYAVKGYTNIYGDVWRNEILAINKQVEYVYGGLYTVIGRCNFVLDNIAAVEANTSDDEQLDKLDTYKGHIYFARALAYSELLKCFCKAYESDEEAANELGVVLQSSYVNPSEIPRLRVSHSHTTRKLPVQRSSTWRRQFSVHFSRWTRTNSRHRLRDRRYVLSLQGHLLLKSIWIRSRLMLPMRQYVFRLRLRLSVRYSRKARESLSG